MLNLVPLNARAFEGLASLAPLNARAFFKNLTRDSGDTSSLITPEDLSPEEIEFIYQAIAEQDKENLEVEERLRPELSSLIPRLEEGISKPSSPQGNALRNKEGIGWYRTEESDPEGKEVIGEIVRGGRGKPTVTSYGVKNPYDNETFSKNVQIRLDKAKRQLDSFDKTRNKTSVRFYDRQGGEDDSASGPGFINTVIKSFTSPAYNIGTTLGSFNAFKNEDGTVTIKARYNWTGQKDDPEGGLNLSLSNFIDTLKKIPPMLHKPEALGNAFMRIFATHKSSPVEFTLPPRQATGMPEEERTFRNGGMVHPGINALTVDQGVPVNGIASFRPSV